LLPKLITNNLESLIQGPTAPDGLKLHLSKGAKRLATPWQVAVDRAERIQLCDIPKGIILDPACGSGIQLAAYCHVLDKAGVGIELSNEVAIAAAGNLWRVGVFERSEEADWLSMSKIIVGDGTDAKACMNLAEISQISFLHIDPARPANSRTHGLNEMRPQLPVIFANWHSYLNAENGSPALILDLSPRLSMAQCDEVEELVRNEFGGIEMTWEWTSRGGGRVDRLSLWAGAVAEASVGCRFVRISPHISGQSKVIKGEMGRNSLKPSSVGISKVRKNEYVSIIDAALTSSGLAEEWLNSVLADEDTFRWLVCDGRRPMIAHSKPLQFGDEGDSIMVQTSGQIEAFFSPVLSEATVGELAELAASLGIHSLTLRATLSPDIQPRLQSTLHRLLKHQQKHYGGFVIDDPTSSQLLICKTV
jgi:hypothetical protein